MSATQQPARKIPIALDRVHIDEPTHENDVSSSTTALLAGQEGKFVTSRQVRARLFRELETNVSLRVEETDNTDTFMVSGRGELHLGILIETMRREGYEFQVSRPEVIVKEIEGVKQEPFERLLVDVPEDYTGAVMQELGPRKAELANMHVDKNQAFLEFVIPTRGLIGFRSEFLRLTKGTGVMNHAFMEYRPWCGEIVQTKKWCSGRLGRRRRHRLCSARCERPRRILHHPRNESLWRHDHRRKFPQPGS